MTARSATLIRVALVVMLLAGCALVSSSAEVVILKDGFVIQGNVRKEVETVFDKASGTPFRMVKSNGFDMIDEGPKVTIFSTHAKQLGAVTPDAKLRPEVKAYTTKFRGYKSGIAHPLPLNGLGTKTGEFNDKWIRTLTVTVPTAAPEKIEQQITHLDPYFIYMTSPTHRWSLGYRTSEWDPRLVRKLLMWHPELAEPDGKCDPLKRVQLAKFLLDAGWLPLAKEEIERLKKDFTGEMTKDTKEQYEKLLKEIDNGVAELAAHEVELALAAGRYQYATDLLAAFPERTAAPAELARVAKVKAELKTSTERYNSGRRYLRRVIDDVTGWHGVSGLVAVGGGSAVAAWQPPKGSSDQALDLARAAEQVLAELHPDSALRIETFVTLAAQAERERHAGKEPTKKPEELLATAVSGWAKGKNGANPNPDAAWKLWSARELVLAYQRGATGLERSDALGRYKKNINLDTDELAQIISLLPPAEPEDLANRTGKPVLLGNTDAGVYQRKTTALPGKPMGVNYQVRLPPEYHHGRAYPVLIVLTHAGINPENILAPLITQADKNGYILVVPEWTDAFGKGWEWDGDEHVWVTGALRDAVRHFTVDNDKVFMIGVGDGANMAMDVGMSHPDLFAGVIPMGPMPKWQGLFIEYWKNAQKLPFYVVTGEQIGDGMKSLRLLYEKWMPYGYPALWTVYKGRGIEWFAAEVPVLFDWMSRKTRVNGTATLALGTGPSARQPWQMIRETDNHFYWLQADKIVTGHLGGSIVPARIQGDVRGNNLIDIQQRHVKKLTIWLSSDMIDWTKPVRVRVNDRIPIGFPQVGKQLAPDLEVLLEDYHNRGDRRTLFLNKIEIDKLP